MFDIGDRVIYMTNDYVLVKEPMCASKKYIKVLGTVINWVYVPEKESIPAHTVYTVKCDNGDILEGWGWRLQKLQTGLDISV